MKKSSYMGLCYQKNTEKKFHHIKQCVNFSILCTPPICVMPITHNNFGTFQKNIEFFYMVQAWICASADAPKMKNNTFVFHMLLLQFSNLRRSSGFLSHFSIQLSYHGYFTSISRVFLMKRSSWLRNREDCPLVYAHKEQRSNMHQCKVDLCFHTMKPSVYARHSIRKLDIMQLYDEEHHELKKRQVI